MNTFNAEELRQFVISSIASSYAAGDAARKVKESDGSTTILFEKGRYTLHDNYFGGEPYGGREVVFFDGKPIWMMVYYGSVRGAEIKPVYTFLMKALTNAPEEFPFRGPHVLQEGAWRYENVWQGEAESFSGTEKIFLDKVCVYEASYLGGLIDRPRNN